MKTMPLQGTENLEKIAQEMGRSPYFASLDLAQRQTVAGKGTLCQFEPEEVITTFGTPSDSVFFFFRGEGIIFVPGPEGETEVGRLQPPTLIGEMGLLLGEARTATVRAADKVLAVQYPEPAFRLMMEKVPGFALALTRELARRLKATSAKVPHNVVHFAPEDLSEEVVSLVPMPFIERHRVVPLRCDGNKLEVGFVDEPQQMVLDALMRTVAGMTIHPVHIHREDFERFTRARAGVEQWSEEKKRPSTAVPALPQSAPRLDPLLKRMVAEGASDLHLTARQKPRWRIDGEILTIADAQVLGREEVYDIIVPVMPERNQEEFKRRNDSDFAYEIQGLARFRVNIFRDHNGVGAVFRQIPAKILTVEQLGLPRGVLEFCELPKGLVLVTGPTGSGKSTTLAAMIDRINKSRKEHIITLEDPIEFTHQSQWALVNQREIGAHTDSFALALRAALREDPDIVLVGEMRDLETVQLAIETANTGHLVFGTLHTATAQSTVDRIIDIFPHEQQPQVRAVLSECLKGVVAQTLCKKIGGGRIAALEVLIVNRAVSNLIREGKTYQIQSIMQTGQGRGMSLLNVELARLVKSKIVDYEEALSCAIEKEELARLCGMPAPPQA